ncbi:UPF0755 protein [Seinonella peptonophila]|uniref:Endolytic murein transglycosylase n=1 Tax=Seinonella peptonophila TaxID=112248 RepID=A0A1M4W9E6_9BACL|nr:endolytic transglycosylase MltG [Seinonella peptonophila]SHE77888.1 UPF0755 protein [Seinonella peptonophila]
MKWFWRIFFTFLLITGWALLVYSYINFTLESPKRTSEVEIMIPANATLKDIGATLKKQGLIRDATFFRYYAWYTRLTNLKPGYYQIKPDENLDQIIERLHGGKQNTVKITVPEGKNIEEVAAIISKAGFNGEEFKKKANTKLSNYIFEQDIPTRADRKYRYEGYLFPSTYEFKKGEYVDKIAKSMLDQFAERMTKLRVRDRLKDRNLTVDQWVTIASIVEREGRAKQELPKIAGVIFNRLDKKMKLEVDATIVFAMKMDEKKGKIDTRYPSPYNTYLVNGLPPGPIAAPSENALKAVLYPEQNDYLFYVTKSDGSGEHYFAKTAAEHLHNIQLSNQNQKKQKK